MVSPVPSSFSEIAGSNASFVTVSTAAPVPADLAVTLVSSNLGEAIVNGPNPAVIPAGVTSVTFDIRAVDDMGFDGNQIIALQASAPGAGTASTNVTVLDDEDTYSPPANYYAAAGTLTGSDLKAALHTSFRRATAAKAFPGACRALFPSLGNAEPASLSNAARITVKSGNRENFQSPKHSACRTVLR